MQLNFHISALIAVVATTFYSRKLSGGVALQPASPCALQMWQFTLNKLYLVSLACFSRPLTATSCVDGTCFSITEPRLSSDTAHCGYIIYQSHVRLLCAARALTVGHPTRRHFLRPELY